MLGIQNLGVFVVAGLLLNVTPGQDTMYILGRSIAQGWRAGVASVMGIGTGCLVHTVLAAVGLSAVLAASPRAFDVVRFVGAAYLVYLGARMILDRSALVEAGAAEADGAWKIYRQGVLTNVLNPKVAVFFLAFLPQFIDPAVAVKAWPMLVLGCIFTFNGVLWCLCLVAFASAISGRLRKSDGVARGMKRAAGALFVGLGVRLAVSR